jgi:hypothetical protein
MGRAVARTGDMRTKQAVEQLHGPSDNHPLRFTSMLIVTVKITQSHSFWLLMILEEAKFRLINGLIGI